MLFHNVHQLSYYIHFPSSFVGEKMLCLPVLDCTPIAASATTEKTPNNKHSKKKYKNKTTWKKRESFIYCFVLHQALHLFALARPSPFIFLGLECRPCYRSSLSECCVCAVLTREPSKGEEEKVGALWDTNSSSFFFFLLPYVCLVFIFKVGRVGHVMVYYPLPFTCSIIPTLYYKVCIQISETREERFTHSIIRLANH